MKAYFLVLALFVALMFVIIANTADGASWDYDEVRISTCSVTVAKTRALPSNARITKMRVLSGKHELDGLAVNPTEAYWYGHGISVRAKVMRRTGPITITVASMRPNRCIKVRFTVRWFTKEREPGRERRDIQPREDPEIIHDYSLRGLVESRHIIASCDYRPAECSVHPEPHPSAKKRKK